MSTTEATDRTEKRVFVTVGTTSFDQLVEAATQLKFLKLLASQGYTHLTLQIGQGEFEPDPPNEGVSVEWYRYKQTLRDDMSSAALIISHGGAGSITESLSLGKPLIVVVNEVLMSNHQTELARQLHREGCLLYTNHSNLYHTVGELDLGALRPYESGRPELFGQYLDNLVGFDSHDQQ